MSLLSDTFLMFFSNLFEMHAMPVGAHNRYWASDTTYAKKNGGMYDFVVEKDKAIPTDKVPPTFFEALYLWVNQLMTV